MRTVWVMPVLLGLGVLVALAWAPSVGAQEGGAGGPAALVRRYVAALNAKDSAAALEVFADDALYGGGAGKEYIRGRLERDFSVNRRMTITAIEVSGNTVTWSWRAEEDPYRALNVPPIEGTDVAMVENGVIVFNGGPGVDPDSVRRQQAALPFAVATRTAQVAQATQVAASGLLGRLPDTQERGVPPTVPWAAGVVVLLGTAVALAALGRPQTAA